MSLEVPINANNNLDAKMYYLLTHGKVKFLVVGLFKPERGQRRGKLLPMNMAQ